MQRARAGSAPGILIMTPDDLADQRLGALVIETLCFALADPVFAIPHADRQALRRLMCGITLDPSRLRINDAIHERAEQAKQSGGGSNPAPP
jgi:hypothetical protein